MLLMVPAEPCACWASLCERISGVPLAMHCPLAPAFALTAVFGALAGFAAAGTLEPDQLRTCNREQSGLAIAKVKEVKFWLCVNEERCKNNLDVVVGDGVAALGFAVNTDDSCLRLSLLGMPLWPAFK